MPDQTVQRTPLYALHQALGARFAPFAGYEMPIHYAAGVMAEHLNTRAAAGLFDVSHMGQIALVGDRVAEALETLVPADIVGLGANRQRYGVFTNADGGVLDDLMIARLPDRFLLVVNAGGKCADLAHLIADMPGGVCVHAQFGRALLAVQGPAAEGVLAPLCPAVASMRFMDVIETAVAGRVATVSRSGYTGEDGFEIGLDPDDAEPVARAILARPGVLPAGLGARDSLRLEAGLCLYGHDLDERTTPIEAALGWSIPKVRRPGGARAGGYPGADAVAAQLARGSTRRRVGLRPEGRAPVRPPSALFEHETGGEPIGGVSSGGFGPTVGAPVAMGYVPHGHAAPGTRLWADVRGRRLPLAVAALPFVAPGFKR